MGIDYDVAEGVHLLSSAYVNCYLVEGEGGLTLVDAGLPRMWPLLVEAVARLGRELADVKALLVTHGHFDHLGFAKRLHQKNQVPVIVHPDDRTLVASPYSYRPQRNRFLYLLSHPGGWGPIGRMAVAGALTVEGVEETEALKAGVPLDVPGSPVAIATPGHTAGHCGFLLRDRDVVLAGDALVTFDPYTGRSGPQIVATAATSDADQAMASLDALAQTGVRTVLTGHGDPWRNDVGRAVDIARHTGIH